MTPPLIWSIAGNDSGGGAGLSADARAAQALGVHLCPVVAAVTAQHSRVVTHIAPVAPELLAAQLDALAADMPPAAIKTGLLGSAAHVQAVARCVDGWRARGHAVALVVDPVLGASTGAGFADAATLQAYQEQLLPRASIVTPNLGEARRLARLPDASAPALAAALRAAGAKAVAITGGDTPAQAAMPHPAPGPASAHGTAGSGSTGHKQARPHGAARDCAHDLPHAPPPQDWALDWIDTPQARGWLALPRIATPHTHGTGCTFASAAAAAAAHGFVSADALVLAKMATAAALAQGHAAGQGAGPVAARPGFAQDPRWLPWLSWDETPALPPATPAFWPAAPAPQAALHGLNGQPGAGCALYAIVDSPARLRQVLQAGVRLVQLRIKTPASPDRAWQASLRAQLAQALADCRAANAVLVINDHWQLAVELAAEPPPELAAEAAARPVPSATPSAARPAARSHAPHIALHLGQEDLLALGPAGRAALAASGLRLGISSHSLWELARARSLHPWYVACGPVWPTLTKAMPWRAQGLHNLRWWTGMAGCPVVAIGGILTPEQAVQAAAQQASAVCVVRGLGDNPAATVPAWQAAIAQGQALPALGLPALPLPTLAG